MTGFAIAASTLGGTLLGPGPISRRHGGAIGPGTRAVSDSDPSAFPPSAPQFVAGASSRRSFVDRVTA